MLKRIWLGLVIVLLAVSVACGPLEGPDNTKGDKSSSSNSDEDKEE